MGDRHCQKPGLLFPPVSLFGDPAEVATLTTGGLASRTKLDWCSSEERRRKCEGLRRAVDNLMDSIAAPPRASLQAQIYGNKLLGVVDEMTKWVDRLDIEKGLRAPLKDILDFTRYIHYIAGPMATYGRVWDGPEQDQLLVKAKVIDSGIRKLCDWISSHSSSAVLEDCPHFFAVNSGAGTCSSAQSSTPSLAAVSNADLQEMLRARMQASRGM